MNKKIPRGIRNNNPLNIRRGNNWIGEVDNPTDKEFEQFQTMELGLRAAFLLLRRYILRYGLKTVYAVISRWAPPTENHTNLYIGRVCQLSRLTPETILEYEDREMMETLVWAMCIVENGQEVSIEIIRRGYNLTLTTLNQ